MNFNLTEQYVLSMLATGILQAGYNEAHLSKTQYELYCNEAYKKLGTTVNIISLKLDADPFMTIRQMDSYKKEYVKVFLFEILQKVPNCETAEYYVMSTLEQGNLITNI